ncbi:hypothetical protein T05_11457 [Trichinella murrelli]|uniref:Ig-like domain-containing protein n=1 Tax=Trichinella murrelli TaxID=144512 RepID=A0A0V0U7P2_9BILA|nr:hypothetical protein T05_11457 [Trichinella murrelli]
MKKEFEKFIPYNSSWRLGIQWLRLTPHGFQPIAYPDSFPMVYRNYEVSNDTLKIISAQEDLHSGWYMCTVNRGPHQLLATAFELSVDVCKFEDFLYKDYCKFGLCKISKDDFNLTELNCVCEPGYSGFGCIHRTKILRTYIWLAWIPVFVMSSTTIVAVTIIFFVVDASVASDFIKDEEGYIEIPPVQFRKEAYFDLRSGHGATISCQSIKEELLPFVKSEENWQTQTHWYKKNYSNWQLVTVPSDMPQILQNLRFYGEDIEIASLLAGVHNGDYLCIVSIVNKSIAVAMNIRLDVFDCKQIFTVSHGYCFHGLCSLLDKNFKHSRMHCDCQPGYSGLYCAERNNDAFLHNRICWIPFFIIASVIALVAVVAFFASFARMLAHQTQSLLKAQYQLTFKPTRD